MIVEHFYDSQELLRAALQQEVITGLELNLQETGRASIAVSGGSSPKPFYQALSQADLDWANVDVALVDERWLEPTHESSNAAFVAATLLQNKAAAANFIPMKNLASSPELGLPEAEQAYQALSLPFDVTILGMGPDGHTASLFPNSEGLEVALSGDAHLASILATKSDVTGDNLQRMTLSLQGVCNSKKLILFITGEKKREVYQAAKNSSDVLGIPVSAVLNQNQVDVHVYWAP
jgi:6-phosphogluconolactonase